MTDQNRPTPAQTPSFEAGKDQADRAREQGLGLDDPDKKATREPGAVRTANEDSDVEGGGRGSDPDALNQSTGI